MDSLANHSDISYSYAVDRNTLKDYVTKIVTSIGQAPVDAQVVVKSGVPTVLPDKPGRSVSSERLTQLVEDSMQQAGAVATGDDGGAIGG